jgi:hypothetical protein
MTKMICDVCGREFRFFTDKRTFLGVVRKNDYVILYYCPDHESEAKIES